MFALVSNVLVAVSFAALAYFLLLQRRWQRWRRDAATAKPQRFTRRGIRSHYDFIVVGSGSAGCAAAAQLIRKLPKATVLLVEAGQERHTDTLTRYQTSRWIGIGFDQAYDWFFHTLPSKILNGRTMAYARGRTTGGCSAVNACMWVWGDARDYDGWAANGGTHLWSWNECKKAFLEMETYTPNTNSDDDVVGRGSSGPVQVRLAEELSAPLESLIVAAKGSGLCSSSNRDYNSGSNEGVVAASQQNVSSSGERMDAFTSFIEPLLLQQLEEDDSSSGGSSEENVYNRRSHRLHVVSSTLCERVVFDKGVRRNADDDDDDDEDDDDGGGGGAGSGGGGNVRAVGVVLNCGSSGSFYVGARKEVVVSCGALQSPQLLMVSGVGPEDELKNLDVPRIKVLEGVGRNLNDHPCLYVGVNLKAPLPPLTASDYSGDCGGVNVTGFYKSEVSKKEEPERGADMQLVGCSAAMTETVLPISLCSRKMVGHAPYNTVKGMFHYGIIDFLDNALRFFGLERKLARSVLVIGFVLNQPFSRGRITVNGNSSMKSPPAIDLKLLDDRRDFARMVDGVEKLLQLCNRREMASLIKSLGELEGLANNRNKIEQLVKNISAHAWHAAGTCAMGDVVTPRLAVVGVDGLRVVDASVMPTVTSGNTNAPSMMIGWRGGELIAEDYGYVADE
mmetsp:Transcript_48830/g.119571  ORF Transcript_48830/g.119571 Transcript_48830/m.119571 type:complete len:676 (+) Transcript_48830:136-2163(+)